MATTARQTSSRDKQHDDEDEQPTQAARPKLEPLPDLEDETEEPLAELSLLEPVRPTVRIKSKRHPEGKLYELRELNDFGLLEQHALKRDGAEFDRLWRRDKLTKTEGQRIEMLLERLFDQALIVPDEDADIKTRLRDGQKANVIMLFTSAPAIRAAVQIKKQQQDQEPDGDSTMSS